MPVFTAVVDQDRCAGVTMCLQAAPGAFALNGDGQSQFQEGDWDGPVLQEAADECPMSAITVLRDGQEMP
jgi:ferredoxin